MRVKALELFVELSQSDSIRALARAHGVKPSVISRQIESVEYHFRADLFDRSAEGIRLTESGRLLLDHARSTLASLRNARAVMDDLKALQSGEIIIHAVGATAAGVIVPVLAEVTKIYPGLHFQIKVESARNVLAAVAAGEADLGLTTFSPDLTKVKVLHRRPLDHAVIVSGDHSTFDTDSITLEQLTQIPLALPDARFGARLHLNEMASRAGLQLNPVFESGSLETLKGMALAGVGATVLPAICFQREIELGLARAIILNDSDALSTTMDLSSSPGRTLPAGVKKVSAAIIAKMDQLTPPTSAAVAAASLRAQP